MDKQDFIAAIDTFCKEHPKYTFYGILGRVVLTYDGDDVHEEVYFGSYAKLYDFLTKFDPVRYDTDLLSKLKFDYENLHVNNTNKGENKMKKIELSKHEISGTNAEGYSYYAYYTFSKITQVSGDFYYEVYFEEEVIGFGKGVTGSFKFKNYDEYIAVRHLINFYDFERQIETYLTRTEI